MKIYLSYEPCIEKEIVEFEQSLEKNGKVLDLEIINKHCSKQTTLSKKRKIDDTKCVSVRDSRVLKNISEADVFIGIISKMSTGYENVLTEMGFAISYYAGMPSYFTTRTFHKLSKRIILVVGKELIIPCKHTELVTTHHLSESTKIIDCVNEIITILTTNKKDCERADNMTFDSLPIRPLTQKEKDEREYNFWFPM